VAKFVSVTQSGVLFQKTQPGNVFLKKTNLASLKVKRTTQKSNTTGERTSQKKKRREKELQLDF